MLCYLQTNHDPHHDHSHFTPKVSRDQCPNVPRFEGPNVLRLQDPKLPFYSSQNPFNSSLTLKQLLLIALYYGTYGKFHKL